MRSFLAIAFCLLIGEGVAQQRPLLSLTHDLGGLYHPAEVGHAKTGMLSIGVRNQWSDILGNPLNMALRLHAPANFDRLGIGGYIIQQDAVGQEILSVGLDGSYRIHLVDGFLSAGMRFGWQQFKVNVSGLEIRHLQDPFLVAGSENWSAPDLWAGLHFQNKIWWVSISAAHLVNTNFTLESESLEAFRYTHIYGKVERVIKVNSLWQITPSVQGILSQSSPIQSQVSMKATYAKSYALILQHRNPGFVSVGMQVDLNALLPLGNKLVLAYYFEQNVGASSSWLRNAHEVQLHYNLQRKERPAAIEQHQIPDSPKDF